MGLSVSDPATLVTLNSLSPSNYDAAKPPETKKGDFLGMFLRCQYVNIATLALIGSEPIDVKF